MRLLLVALCIIICPQLFADEETAEAALLTPFIYNSVNVITGEYCATETDLSLGGPYSIKVRRHYSSLDPFGWHFNLPNLLYVRSDPLSLPLSPYPVIFEYDQKQRLSCVKINQKNNQKAREIGVRYENEKSTFELETDDGRKLKYLFNDKRELEQVLLNDHSIALYRYAQHPLTKQSQVVYYEKSPGHYVMTEYYQLGGNDVGGTQVVITSVQDHRLGKVRLQRAPLGSDDAPVLMHRFFYYDGFTEVYDALNNKVIYRFDGQTQRLNAIEHFDKEGKIYRSENFYWDQTSDSIPRIVSRSVKDGNDKIHICRTFAYNDKGQVVKETLYGNLTGNCSAPLTLQANGLPVANGIESYAIYSAYETELLCLKIKQTEDNGTTIHYIYAPNTTRLSGKLIEDKTGIKLRHFYQYDENDLLIETVLDDGASSKREDVSGVTERHIRKYNLRKELPGIGQPESIEERYLDRESGVEKLLATTRFSYATQGVVLQEDFDADGVLIQSQQVSYDSLGRQISTYGLQDGEQSFEYDMHGNKAFSCKCTKDNKIIEVHATYDFSNRLINKEELFADGHKVSSDYLYNANGNRICK